MDDWPERDAEIYKDGYELMRMKEHIEQEKDASNKNSSHTRIQCDWISCKYNSCQFEDEKDKECLKARVKLIANKEDDKLECKSYRKGRLN